MSKLVPVSIIPGSLKQLPSDLANQPDIQFLKNVTGAFVVPGLLNPRESIAYFGFFNDGLLEPVVLGLRLV
jgi:hypothetical protein